MVFCSIEIFKMKVLQGLVLLAVFSSYLIHADVIDRWSYEEEEEEDRSSSYGGTSTFYDCIYVIKQRGWDSPTAEGP